VRIVGYCTSCRRIKYVRVGAAGLAMLGQRSVATGVCSDCEEARHPRVFHVSRAQLRTCPERIMDPSHWYDDGTCRCRR